MTRFSTLLAIATSTVITGSLLASPNIQYVNLQVVQNNNMTIQVNHSLLFTFDQNGTDGLNSQDTTNPSMLDIEDGYAHPFSFTDHFDVITQVDSRPEITTYSRIGFGFLTKFAAEIKVTAETFASISDTINSPGYMWIEDIASGETYPLLGDTVKLDIPANTDFSMNYYLHIGPALPKTVHNETCFHAYDGSVTITNPHNLDWNLTIYNNANLLSSSHITNQDTTIGNLTAGYYNFVSSVNNVNIDSLVIYVDGASQIIPYFNVSDYNPTTDNTVYFMNMTTGATSYSWDFGDNDGDFTSNTSHQYLTPGNYQVELTATNAIGCSEILTDSIFVTSPYSTIHQAPSGPELLGPGGHPSSAGNAFMTKIYTSPNNLRMTIEQNQNEEMVVELYNTNGQLLSSTTSSNTTVDLSVPQAGIYIVKMISKNGQVNSKTILINN